jgi:hypothetical protein
LLFSGAGQTLSHCPQFDVALEVSTHEPLQFVNVPQSVPHFPDLQTMPAPHLFGQLPQCSESELQSTHAPLQLVYPELQWGSQPALPHVTKPLSGAVQTLPHAPQLEVSASNWTQVLEQAV